MGFVDAILHALNFMLPALAVALLVTFSGRFLKKNKSFAVGFIGQCAINLIVCLAVLMIGLVITGRDGKMLTYLAMVMASGTVQWVLSGGWRK
jgi:peptidoglycan biosynthesis protein MviN/MurJ (putative lipid II flippase)